MRLQFPHISRFFSARTALWVEKLVFWSILTTLLAINLLNRNSTALLSKNMLAVLLAPSSSQVHIQLAMDYWDDRKFELAQRELLLANERMHLQTNKPDGSLLVLGATTSPIDLLSQWQEEPIRLESDYQFWKRIATEKPDYRDAQLMAAILAWQLGHTKEANAYIVTLQNLDGVSEKFKTMIRVLAGK